MSAIDVSVIIPTYRHSEYVLQTLESVFAQSFRHFEVIVVNDGSPDDTATVLQPLIAAEKVVYIEQANAGQAAARNRGLQEARGIFIAFLDDDDLWPADKLQWQVDYLLANPGQVCVGGMRADLKDGQLLVSYNPDAAFSSLQILAGGIFASPGQALIRADALRAIGGFDPTLWGVDDTDLWYRLAKFGPIFRSGKVSLHYRIHDGNASRHWRRMFDNHERMLNKHIADLPAQERSRHAPRLWSQFANYEGRGCLNKIKAAMLFRGSWCDAMASVQRIARLLFTGRVGGKAVLGFLLLSLPARFKADRAADRLMNVA